MNTSQSGSGDYLRERVQVSSYCTIQEFSQVRLSSFDSSKGYLFDEIVCNEGERRRPALRQSRTAMQPKMNVSERITRRVTSE
jgi:hypothetical protein